MYNLILSYDQDYSILLAVRSLYLQCHYGDSDWQKKDRLANIGHTDLHISNLIDEV